MKKSKKQKNKHANQARTSQPVTSQARNYCVGFVDILGHKVSYGQFSLVPNEYSPEFSQVLKDMLHPVEWMQYIVENHGYLDVLPSLNGSRIDYHTITGKVMRSPAVEFKTLAWSDCMAFFFAFDRYHFADQLYLLLKMIVMSGWLVLEGLAKGYPLRGGLELGWGIEFKGSMFGNAFAEAYALESKIAKYPRIMIGKKLTEYLNNFVKAEFEYLGIKNVVNHDILTAKIFAKKCLDLIGEDSNGDNYVDYLNPKFIGNLNKETYDSAHEFVRNTYHTFSQENQSKSDSEKLAARYKELLDYFDSHLSSN